MAIDTHCPIPKGSEDYGDHGSAWKWMCWVALAFTAITTVIAVSLINMHLRRYRAPREQRHIVRMIFSVVVFCLVAYLEIWKYSMAQYLDPISDLYEAFGLCSLYLLFVQFAAPTGEFDEYTLTIARSAEEGNDATFDWVRISWILVFQYPVVELVCVAIQEATEATGHFCGNSLDPWFAHLYVQILNSISIGACVTCILKFRNHMKKRMRARRGLAKLVCFKVIVGVRFFQTWVVSLLLQYKVVKPNATFSYNDISWGIPAVATCVEMTFCSLLFWYAFSSTEYSAEARPNDCPLPTYKAILHAYNPLDLFMGIAKIPYLFLRLRQSGDWSRWKARRKQSGIQGLIRKAVRKTKGTGDGSQGQGRYKRMEEGMESLVAPPRTRDAEGLSTFSQQDPELHPLTTLNGR